MTLPAVESAELRPAIELRQIGVERAADDGDWEIGFLITNRGGDALGLIAARLPHGQFRGAELRFDPPPSVAPGETLAFAARVHCHEPPGLVTENAFAIFLVQWRGERWRIFTRVRITVDATGTPRAVTESITTQKAGFSGVEDLRGNLRSGEP